MRTEIRESRRTAWDKVDYRSHQIARVYAQTDNDFLFIGNAQMRTRKGYEFKEEFIGRVVVDDARSPNPRVKHFNVWVVSFIFRIRSLVLLRIENYCNGLLCDRKGD